MHRISGRVEQRQDHGSGVRRSACVLCMECGGIYMTLCLQGGKGATVTVLTDVRLEEDREMLVERKVPLRNEPGEHGIVLRLTGMG